MIRNFAKPVALAVALALPFSITAQAKEKKVDQGEQELTELLEGYEAGEPVNCLNSSQRDRLRIIDRTALVFRDGKTLYVNRTASPRYIDDFDVPVFKPFGSRLCRSDQVEWVQRFSGIGGPVTLLKEFVPYTKVEKES